jgi:hypothetical protein
MKCSVCKQEVEYPEFSMHQAAGKAHGRGEDLLRRGGARHIQSLKDRQYYSPTHVLVPGNYAKDRDGKLLNIAGFQ